MSRSIKKTLSLILALAMIASVAALPVFAALDAEHECTCDDAGVYVACTHPVMTTTYGSKLKDYDDNVHRYLETITYSCTSCSYSRVEYTGNYLEEVHNYTLSNGGTAAACIVCGHLRDA